MTHPLEYRRMIAARDATKTRLRELDRRLREEAGRAVISPAAHRGDSGWRKSDETAWQAALADLRYRSRNEIGALTAKLERQQGAIRAWLAKPKSHRSVAD
ncbi:MULTISPECIES: hypothetical protein [Erythrobacter]|jgi:hypothetical protein|uniref:hypothetical protein n=1 Tax=Erythrobacter TaxID=1041 RepID=UPI00083530AF|nr:MULTISPECIES: hypothetical protein [Erythrobacter]MBA4045263.1 hypothetical protein [Erythrobacter sp.]